MFNIRDFLKRVQSVRTGKLFAYKTVQDIMKKHIGIDIPVGSISFKSSTIYIANISQSARSEIYIKKQNIIQELNQIQGMHKIVDIR